MFHLRLYSMTLEEMRNDVLPCWIGPTNCQPKWLRTKSAETRQKPSPNRRSRFLKTEPQKPSFRFLNFEVGSIRFLEIWYPTFSSGSAHPYHRCLQCRQIPFHIRPVWWRASPLTTPTLHLSMFIAQYASVCLSVYPSVRPWRWWTVAIQVQ